MINHRFLSWLPPIGAWLAMSMHSSSSSRGTGRDRSRRLRTCFVVVSSRSALAMSMAGTAPTLSRCRQDFFEPCRRSCLTYLGGFVVSKRAIIISAIAVVCLATPAARADLPGSLLPPLRNAVVDTSQQVCSPDDHVEPGLQGDVPRATQTSGEAKQGFNCGLSVVGHA